MHDTPAAKSGIAPPVKVSVAPVKPRVETLGNYRLVSVLGEGGMARVHLAEHVVIGKKVAIKTLLPQFVLCREARDMLMREATITASIKHPNVIDIYDFAVDDFGKPYFVMELAPGETLEQRLDAGTMGLAQCLDIAVRLADAVAAIHAAGFLHRDIKPQNVLLTSNGRRTIPKLIDFGIAKALEPGSDRPDEGMVGTPRAMAPEQIAQDHVDERTDIWALGVVFYQMLTGRMPFSTGGTVREDLVAIVTEQPHPLPRVLTNNVRAIVESCLCKEPEDRPPSAAALVDQLRLALSDHLARKRAIARIVGA